ncbi:MAG TPA: hypothetical protein VIK04_12265 [Solirubrobacteraceae bacterium]
MNAVPYGSTSSRSTITPSSSVVPLAVARWPITFQSSPTVTPSS